ncbi:sugar-transfer associated ATP-grasp domain-containing protein [Gryllotalpicola reticulitermitis]|uniref:Sugar-transfer associated ATP-grasp domain-containing protein n=1 Tax=Gryllotalpicola reticulitermitis TaxID=1184153 RepID=A0ABV8Q4E7_9MICO
MSPRSGIAARFDQVVNRARRIDVGSVVDRARAAAKQHHKASAVVFVDMMIEAGFHETAFQDYVDWDFAMLNSAERRTFMTHPLSQRLSEQFDEPAGRLIFQDKIAFDDKFNEFLGREWLRVESSSVEEVRDFVTRHGRVIGKVPFSNSGHGVERHEAADVTDWAAFRASLIGKGQTLLEELIVQHPTLAAICPGTVNTTRVTAFFDGQKAQILSMAQKFGRGAASDQQTFGGFYSMLDIATGRAKGPGYDSHDNVHLTHPESGVSIPDFQLPLFETLQPFMDRLTAVVPTVRYVGWDVVMGPTGPVVVEGNWAVGVYDNKPSVTGVRTGSRPRFQQVMGF